MNLQSYRYVVIGDLVIDVIKDKFGNTVKISGGGSKFNVLSRMAKYGKDTMVLAGCGNDEKGTIAIKSLEYYGIDISQVIRKGNKTRQYELTRKKDGTYSSKKINWNEEYIITIEIALNRIKPNDVIILDKLDSIDIKVIQQIQNDKVIDIGRIAIVEKFSNQELINLLSGKFELIQLHSKVRRYLLARFGLEDESELMEIFKPNLLIVTRGNKGADFILSNGKVIRKELINPTIEVDNTGAGDAFFSKVILNYYEEIKGKKEIDEQFIDKLFDEATQITRRVVSFIGAKGDLQVEKRRILARKNLHDSHEVSKIEIGIGE